MRRRRALKPEVPPLAPLPPDAKAFPTHWRWATVLVLAVYLGLSAGHIRYTPIARSSEFNYINAPDEAAHLGYVRALAVGHRLPVRGDAEFPTYEWHQPPLYYALAS